MTPKLVDIIYALTIAPARMPAELPRGLHLVHYPAGDNSAPIAHAQRIMDRARAGQNGE